jgi:tetratricopeptide (TPR) repeat protein
MVDPDYRQSPPLMSRLIQLQEMLKDDPQDPFLRYAIAIEHAAAGDRKEAIAGIEKLLADKPDYLGAYYQLGQLYEQEELAEKAITIYSRGITLAQQQRNRKTLGELRSALDLLED